MFEWTLVLAESKKTISQAKVSKGVLTGEHPCWSVISINS